VPLAGLLDPAYIQARSALIGKRIADQPPPPGEPPGAKRYGADHTLEPGGTTHLVIVDDAGNVLSMTTTVESIFGSGRMVDGFFLNNQLTDFSFSPQDADGRPAANAVGAGKRPRSAMSPTIVFDRDGHFVAATGSAGGPAIIAYILKTLIGALDWHMTMQSAISLPNLVAHGDHFTAETAKFAPELLNGMNQRGLNPQPGQYEESGLQGVLVRADGTYEGGADPRREGVALSY
jgi:gamma-glutamyltranspeptidase/glutathione hydrolase